MKGDRPPHMGKKEKNKSFHINKILANLPSEEQLKAEKELQQWELAAYNALDDEFRSLFEKGATKEVQA